MYKPWCRKRWPRGMRVLGVGGRLLGSLVPVANSKAKVKTVSPGAVLFGLEVSMLISFGLAYLVAGI